MKVNDLEDEQEMIMFWKKKKKGGNNLNLIRTNYVYAIILEVFSVNLISPASSVIVSFYANFIDIDG